MFPPFFVYLCLKDVNENIIMKHLYIIGNGFDIFTGLKTRYVDFSWWLENNYPFIYENIKATYDMDVEWWNDFEVQLGKLNIRSYIRKYPPREKSIEEILKDTKERRAFEEKYNLPPDLHYDRPCASRLRGLLDVLQYCFEKWVENCQSHIVDPKYVHLEIADSFFINFNYTDVLQWLYKIPEDCVLHIHGRASKHERLIFGHNTSLLGYGSREEEKQVCFELGKYEKNPYEYIYKHDELLDILRNVEYVHVYGFSFSPVDEDYMDWIYNNTLSTSHWEVSWFSMTDKQRIDSFIFNHWRVKDRIKLIRLEDITLR